VTRSLHATYAAKFEKQADEIERLTADLAERDKVARDRLKALEWALPIVERHGSFMWTDYEWALSLTQPSP